MRTTVYTSSADPDETDEFPGCVGSVYDDGTLVIAEHPGGLVETEYAPGEWASVQTTAEGDDGGAG